MEGKVKWFNAKKGYGFITGGDGKDVFVHYSDIVVSGYKTLKDGQEVTYDLADSTKGPKAANVKPKAKSA